MSKSQRLYKKSLKKFWWFRKKVYLCCIENHLKTYIMTRQEKRKQERVINKVTKGKRLVSLGFFYKGAGITVNDESQVKELVKTFEDALPFYQMAIKQDGQSEIDFYYSQLEPLVPLLGKGLVGTIPHQDQIIFMMNIYVLTRLGIIEDDNMNGLQYIYQG